MPISEVFNVDCMKGICLLPDKFFGLMENDPPYFDGPNKLGYYGARTSSVGVSRGGYEKIGTWSIPDKKYFNQVDRVSERWIIWGANYYSDLVGEIFTAPRQPDFKKFIKDHPVGWILWDKVNYSSTFADCELAFTNIDMPTQVFRFMWNGMLQGKSVNNGHIMQGNKKLNEKRIHPTQKPIPIYKYQNSRFAIPGRPVGDTHMGSQSSRIAAFDMGFDYYGWETEKKYFDAGNKRFQQFTNKLKLF